MGVMMEWQWMYLSTFKSCSARIYRRQRSRPAPVPQQLRAPLLQQRLVEAMVV
jgi:hypothetical protein